MVQHTIYVVRHGNSEGNATSCILNAEADVLTELGKTQATSLGEALADVKFTKVLSSDYSRTMETTGLVLSKSNHSKDVPIEKEIRLREKHFDAPEPVPYAVPMKELAAFLAEGKSAMEWNPEYTETWDAMLKRADNFFSELFSILDKSHDSETVMLTSHGFFIQTLMLHLKRSDKFDISNWNDSALKLSRNCSYMMFTLEGRPDGFVSEKRPLNMLKIHEWGHLDATDHLIEFAKSPRGQLFQNCIQT